MKRVLSNNGISLVEVMVIGAVISATTIGIMNLVYISTRGGKALGNAMDANEIMDRVRTTLSDPESCTASLLNQAVSPASTLTINPTFGIGTAITVGSTPTTNRRLVVTQLFAEQNGAAIRTWSDATNNYQTINANITMSMQEQSPGQDGAARGLGANTFTRRFPVFMSVRCAISKGVCGAWQVQRCSGEVGNIPGWSGAAGNCGWRNRGIPTIGNTANLCNPGEYAAGLQLNSSNHRRAAPGTWWYDDNYIDSYNVLCCTVLNQ